MKSKIIISIPILFVGLFALGQTSTVQTPWGSTVDVWTQQDMGTQARHDYDDLYSYYEYRGADFLPTLPGGDPPYPSSSSKFNCHGYAWYMFWRGSNQFDAPWQMDYDEAENYFNDPSYVECSASEADVLWINNGAHSALTTEDPDELLSKWASGPLAIHGKGSGESPWPITGSNTTYYKRCSYDVTGGVDTDITMNHCAVKFKNTSVLNYVDLEIEYEEAVLIEGTFTTGTGATLYFHPD